MVVGTSGRSRAAGRTAPLAVAIAVLVTGLWTAPRADASSPATEAARRHAGPTADLTGPVTGGNGVSLLLSSSEQDLAKVGYQQTEWFASGDARSFTPVGGQPSDGRWTVTPDSQASYKTRFIVRAPTRPADFNGTVIVEWLNVTGGFDLGADLAYMAPELYRSGYAWIGISAQQIGIQGGPSPIGQIDPLPNGLVGADPVRYGSLHHPGDVYSFDMFSQITRAIRDASSTPGNPLVGLRPTRFIATGESQSATTLTTYINAIQPRDHLFDGFFVHSRFGGAFPLGAGSVTDALTGNVRIRSDIGVPVLLFETETDEEEFNYFDARQRDTRDIRLWDVAGAAHADTYLLGVGAPFLGCTTVNQAPTHFVVEGALDALNRWVHTGNPPPPKPRLHVTLVTGNPKISRDAHGIAIGGIRGPWVTVPVATFSGSPAETANASCALFGSTTPFAAATLAELYPSQTRYLTEYTRATNRSIRRGDLLPADRAAVIAFTTAFPS
jgi:hypothetical protein